MECHGGIFLVSLVVTLYLNALQRNLYSKCFQMLPGSDSEQFSCTLEKLLNGVLETPGWDE